MKSTVCKRAYFLLFVVFTCVVFLGYTLHRSYVRESGIEAMKEWARMSPLPKNVTDLHVEMRGGVFTREFIIRFKASSIDLNLWLESSPGTSGLTPRKNGRSRVYLVEPGGGAEHAEVTIDDDSDTVVIRTYWS